MPHYFLLLSNNIHNCIVSLS